MSLKKLGITRKKTYGYRERDEQQRQKFKEKLLKLVALKCWQIVYLDEAGIDIATWAGMFTC